MQIVIFFAHQSFCRRRCRNRHVVSLEFKQLRGEAKEIFMLFNFLTPITISCNVQRQSKISLHVFFRAPHAQQRDKGNLHID